MPQTFFHKIISHLKTNLLVGRILFPNQRTCRRKGSGAVTALVHNAALLYQHRALQLSFLLQAHHRNSLGIPGSLRQKLGRRENHTTAVGGIQCDLLICIQRHSAAQGALIRIGSGKLLSVGLGLIGAKGHLGSLTVFKEEQV